MKLDINTYEFFLVEYPSFDIILGRRDWTSGENTLRDTMLLFRARCLCVIFWFEPSGVRGCFILYYKGLNGIRDIVGLTLTEVVVKL